MGEGRENREGRARRGMRGWWMGWEGIVERYVQRGGHCPDLSPWGSICRMAYAEALARAGRGHRFWK